MLLALYLKRVDHEQFGSQEHELLIELQRQACRAYAHFARRIFYSDQSRYGEAENRQKASALSRIEDEGLLGALGRLRRLTSKAKALGLLESSFGQKLENLDADIKDLRDMREHYDEYVLGEGRHQTEFIKAYKFEDGRTIIQCPMGIRPGPQNDLMLPGRRIANELGSELLLLHSWKC